MPQGFFVIIISVIPAILLIVARRTQAVHAVFNRTPTGFVAILAVIHGQGRHNFSHLVLSSLSTDHCKPDEIDTVDA